MDKKGNLDVCFYSDAPIDTTDNLNSKHLDKYVRNIQNHLQKNLSDKGYVIGINGKWGIGKTSVLNLLKSSLDETEELCFRYNPWYYPEEDHVTLFFKQLANKIDYKFNNDKYQKIANRLRLIGDIYKQFSQNYDQSLFSNISKIFYVILILLFYGSSFLSWNPIKYGISLLLIFILLSADKIIHFVADIYTKKSKITSNVSSLQKEIEIELGKRKERIFIIVDDLDRLPPKSICDIFQLIKNYGNLDYFTYILAYDQKVIKSILKKEYSDQYEDFINKIVQIEFTVPLPHRLEIEDYYKEELGKLLGSLNINLDEYWDREEWSNVFYLFLRYSFKTYRDVKRILNGIKLNIDNIIQDEIAEVNLIDFVIIETLRIQFSDVYEFIRNNPNIFIFREIVNAPLGSFDEKGENLKSQYDSFINNYHKEYQLIIDSLLRNLFPRLDSLGTDNYGNELNEDRLRIESRIGSAEVFDRYFLYSNYEGDISNKVINRIYAVLSNEIERGKELERYYYNLDLIRIIKIIVNKYDSTNDIYKRQIVEFILHTSDYYPSPSWDATSEHYPSFIYYLTMDSLKSMNVDYKKNILVDCINNGKGIYGKVCLVTFLKPEKETSLYSSEDWNILNVNVTTLTRNWFEHSTDIYNHRNILYILHYLKNSIGKEELEKLIYLRYNDPKKLISFLKLFYIRRAEVKYGLPGERVSYYYDFQHYDNFLNLRFLQNKIHELLNLDSLNKLETEMVEFIKVHIQEYMSSPEEYNKKYRYDSMIS